MKVLVVRVHKGEVIQTGVFGKHMDINLTLDGPVNILLGRGD